MYYKKVDKLADQFFFNDKAEKLMADESTVLAHKYWKKGYIAAQDDLDNKSTQKTGWISVNDKLPDKDEIVFIAHKNGNVTRSVYKREVGSWRYGGKEHLNVYYWMPMPKFPISEDFRLKTIFGNMKSRCYDINNKHYKYYGGSGIEICEEWNSFDVFKKWALGSGYASHLTIDRINYAKGYSAENCRWTNYKEQANNRSNNRVLVINGESKNLSQWAEEKGLSVYTITSRLRNGWSHESAVLKPVDSNKRNKKAKNSINE